MLEYKAPVLLHQKQTSPHHQLSSKNVFIDFSYERNGQTSDESLRFYFEPWIEYQNDHLDTVILKLKKDPNKKYPPPLRKFVRFTNNGFGGYLIGHPYANEKKMDIYEPVTLVPQMLNDARKWSLEHAKEDGFSGIDDPHRILLHCTFDKGASGSPGFWICPNNGEASVTLMFLRGYPDWYYDDKCRHEKKIGIPPKCLIEQGVSMASIYEDMKTKAPALQKVIFPCSNEDEQMEE